MGEESRQNEHQRVNFAWNLQSKRLPGYSDSMEHMSRFDPSGSPLYLASIFHELENMIIGEHKKKSGDNNTIKIDHFVVDLRYMVLDQKL